MKAIKTYILDQLDALHELKNDNPDSEYFRGRIAGVLDVYEEICLIESKEEIAWDV